MIVGVDIGGTKVAAALVTAEWRDSQKTRVPMVSTGDAATGFAAVKEAIGGDLYRGTGGRGDGHRDLLARAARSFDGSSAESARICRAGAIFRWLQETEKAFGVPTRVDNDGNAAGLAEAIWGAGVGISQRLLRHVGHGNRRGDCFRPARFTTAAPAALPRAVT
jgi:glucokinase